jgi:SAM-dependent methyltransferase
MKAQEFLKKINERNKINLSYNEGFIIDGCSQIPFYDFSLKGNNDATPNWSDELEGLHEKVSESHPVDFYERQMVLYLLHDYLKNNTYPIICDFGCSRGQMLCDLRTLNVNSLFIGVDIIEKGLYLLHKKEPDILLFKFDITKIPFPKNEIDVIVCLNVLEHIEDDILVIREFSRILKYSGGVACIVVPYGRDLYDYYDKTCMHVRRYGKGELSEKLENEGFEIIYHNYLNSLLYVPFYFKKKLNRIIYRNKNLDANKLDMVEHDINVTNTNVLIRRLFHIDYELTKRIHVPFGIREIFLIKHA